VQINTGAGCHLDADMVARGVQALDPPDGALLVVENVGNLVCPALFDLGEELRVVVVSTPEGDEKPLKYPHMFATADLVLLTKTDLLPYVPFDVDRFTGNVRAVNGRARVLPVCAPAGDGMAAWYAELEGHRSDRPAPVPERLHSS
jgi:hydrogenase nickel incorporation protein HypB